MAAIQHFLDQRRLIDSNGIADGGSIAFYLAGTTTPVTIYSDAGLTVSRTNPVVVGAGATVPPIYLNGTIPTRRVITYPDGSTDDDDPYIAAVGASSLVLQSVYVDSENGADSNGGGYRSKALQTLAAAETELDGNNGTVNLLTDSTWREDLALTTQADVLATGCGQPAIISGADVVTGWTAEGTANVWQKSWTHSVASGSDRFLVMEDGEVLTRVANVATCSSTAGSFVDVRSSSGSPVTLKIHPTGSGNPNSNGKVYEATRRYTALSSDSAVFVKGPLETTAAVGNNGSFVATGHADVCGVLATYGTKHNFFLGSGRAFGCAAYLCEKPTSDELANTQFVSFMNDPTGYTYTYENCIAVQPVGSDSAYSGTAAFYAHGGTSLVSYDTGTMVQCAGIGAIFGGHAGGAATIVDLGNYWRALTLFQLPTASYKLDQTVAYIYTTYDGVGGQTTILNGQELENCAIYFEKRISTDPPTFRTDSGANILDRTTLIMGGAGQVNAHAFISIASSGSFTCNNSIIAGFSGNLLDVPTGVTYTGNNNVFWCDNEFATTDGFEGVWHGTGYTTLGAWQTATGQDANSVYAVKADQAAGDADALFLGWKEAASGTSLDECGPAVGDFRLNPTAKVYDGSGTLKTGTLADGTTPITQCGQQFHRDWNRRASVAGAQSAFPAVPETLAELREYVRAPLAWRF